MEGKYILLSANGFGAHFVQCPFCEHLNHVESQKPLKVMHCYCCDNVFTQPSSKEEESWG